MSLVENWPYHMEKKIFKNCQCNLTIPLLIYLYLEKGRGPSFEQTWISFTRGCLVQCLVDIVPVVMEKKTKMWKVYDTDANEDNNDTDANEDNNDSQRSNCSLEHI